MIIYIGADHRGFKLKEYLKRFLTDKAYTVADVGATQYTEGDDYPDYAKEVGKKVSNDPQGSRGILICGSGFGVDIAANKFPGVRSALPMSPDHVYQARHDDDVNVLSLAADFIDEAEAVKMLQVFLSTPFASESRYTRRLTKISAIESLGDRIE